MTDNDYRIEDGSEKGRPNYTLRRVKFAAAVVGLVVSVTLMLTWHGGGRACGGGRVSGHGPVADGQVRSAR
jgi:hypothetical protein